MDSGQTHQRHRGLSMIPWLAGASIAVGLSVALFCRRKPCPTCPLCHGPIEGALESIQCSHICYDCTIQYFKSNDANDESLYTVTGADAMRHGDCTLRDLSPLNYRCHGNDAGLWSQRQYLRSEVWFIKNLKKKINLEELLGFKLKTVDPIVRYFLLGDYITPLTESQTRLEAVMMYKDVIHQASEIVKSCPYAHPQSVLDFCVQYPKANAEQFQEMKQKIRLVFHLEGRRILHGLTSNERDALSNGPLSDVYEAFSAEDPNRLIRTYLMQWFSLSATNEIMADDGWVNFNWAHGPEDRVAAELRIFWKNRLHRKYELENALKGMDLSIPESCHYCIAYMNGTSTMNLSKVSACVYLSHQMIKLGIVKNTDVWRMGFNRLHQEFQRLDVGLWTSVKFVLDGIKAVIKNQSSEDEDSDEDMVDVIELY